MRDTEGPIQRAIVAYLRQVMPADTIVHSAENALRRGGAAGMRENARRKANGQVAGFPDIIVLPYANIGPLFFEVKAPKGRVSEGQAAFHERLTRLGYPVAVVRSIDDARAALFKWGVGTNERIPGRVTRGVGA